MRARYEMNLEKGASSVKGVQLSDMEREQYQNQIKDLLQAVETLLKSNKAMGEKLDKTTAAYEDLKAKYEKLEGELAMRKRGQYRKGSEKPKDDSSSDKEKTKDEDEDNYIKNGSKNDTPPAEEPEGEEAPSYEPIEKKPRDLSNRPDHYNKIHADVCVIHECDLDKLKEMGLEFIRYTRPVEQFDRVSIVTRQGEK